MNTQEDVQYSKYMNYMVAFGSLKAPGHYTLNCTKKSAKYRHKISFCVMQKKVLQVWNKVNKL